MARALGWQPRGRGFEPHLLHLRPAKLKDLSESEAGLFVNQKSKPQKMFLEAS
jgi:hypothetical protein